MTDYKRGEAAVAQFDLGYGTVPKKIDDFTRLRAEEIDYRMQNGSKFESYQNKLVAASQLWFNTELARKRLAQKSE